MRFTQKYSDWLIESGSLMAPLETTNFHQIEYKNLISMLNFEFSSAGQNRSLL